MQTTKLIVARHGATFNKGDVILRVGAKTNIPLSEEGRVQARRLAARIEELGYYPTRIFSAPLRRALETSLEISSRFHLEASPAVADFLTELDYGEDDGRPETDVVKRLGSMEPEASPSASPEKLEELGKNALKRWNTQNILPQGWDFLRNRVERLETEWRQFGKDVATRFPSETVVAVTSNGIARFSFSLLPENAKRPLDTKLSVGSFGIYEFTRNRWELKAWNER